MPSTHPSFLFIKLKHFGDVLLMTPALAAVRQSYPQANITVLVRQGTDAILEGAGLADEILTTVPPEKNRRSLKSFWDQIRLVQKLREREFDMVFELTDGDRGRWLGALAPARLRCASGYGWTPSCFWRCFYDGIDPSNWHLCHRAEKDHQLVRRYLPLLSKDAPPLHIQPQRTASHVTQQPFVVLHPASRWKRKLWSLEQWLRVTQHLTGKGLHCIISSGPDTAEKQFAQELASRSGPQAEFTGGELSWNALAAIIRSAALFVGIDTAAMHVAAACQTPVVALFGPSIDHHWHPWRTPYEIVSSGEPLHHRFPQFIYDAPLRRMEDIRAEDVIAACDRMLAKKEVSA